MQQYFGKEFYPPLLREITTEKNYSGRDIYHLACYLWHKVKSNSSQTVEENFHLLYPNFSEELRVKVIEKYNNLRNPDPLYKLLGFIFPLFPTQIQQNIRYFLLSFRVFSNQHIVVPYPKPILYNIISQYILTPEKLPNNPPPKNPPNNPPNNLLI